MTVSVVPSVDPLGNDTVSGDANVKSVIGVAVPPLRKTSTVAAEVRVCPLVSNTTVTVVSVVPRFPSIEELDAAAKAKLKSLSVMVIV